MWVRRCDLTARWYRQAVAREGWTHSSPQSFLELWFYIYIYSTAGGVRPASETVTNRFQGKVGGGVSSRLGYLDLAFDLWLSRQYHLDSCLNWRRQQIASGPFFLVIRPLRVLLGYHIRLAERALEGLLSGRLIGTLTRGVIVALNAPWAAIPLTKFLGPQLSDLLTNLLLQPQI